MFLGLDLSLQSTGMCLLDGETYRTATTGSNTLKGETRISTMLQELASFTGARGNDIALAAIEGYAFAGKGHTFHLAEWGGVVRHYLREWGIPFIVVLPQHVKQFGCGVGIATKTILCETLRDRWGVDFLREDWPHRYSRQKKPMPPDWGSRDVHWRNDEADAFVLANIAALYVDSWHKTPTPMQASIIEAIKLDPDMTLSHRAKEKIAANAKKPARG